MIKTGESAVMAFGNMGKMATSQKRDKYRTPGFTMLEILIAIFIFAIVITALFSTYRTVLSEARVVDEGTSTYEMAKNCLNRMIFDLQSAYIPLAPLYKIADMDDPPNPHRFTGEVADIGEGTFSKLRFASLAHVDLEGSLAEGIAEIVYYVQETDTNGYVLRRADNLYPYKEFEENRRDPVLCESIKALTFTYYDQEGREYEVWDSESDSFAYATPTAVNLKLEVLGGAGSLNMETMVLLPVVRIKKQ